MTNSLFPYIVPEQHFAGLLNLVHATIFVTLKKRLHPVFLFHRAGRTSCMYIENDNEKIIITIERRRKPKPKPLPTSDS
jgi:hypothetical protein